MYNRIFQLVINEMQKLHPVVERLTAVQVHFITKRFEQTGSGKMVGNPSSSKIIQNVMEIMEKSPKTSPSEECWVILLSIQVSVHRIVQINVPLKAMKL